jgi:hypothetical protein
VEMYYEAHETTGNIIGINTSGVTPDEVDAFTQTKIFDLPTICLLYKSGLTRVPSAVFTLELLCVLDLKLNNLTCIPEAIGNLIHLEKLIVSHNKLEQLPCAIGKCTKLIKLYCSNNLLWELPNALGKCSALGFLDISCNPLLKKLPLSLLPLFTNKAFTFYSTCNSGMPFFFKQLEFDETRIHTSDKVMLEYAYAFHYPQCREATIALLAFNARKRRILHKDIIRSLMAPMLYASRLDWKFWKYHE